MKTVKGKHINASALIKSIPDSLISKIGEKNQVDYQVKRLYGILIFKLILYTLLRNSRLSTRIMEKYYNSTEYSTLTEKGEHKTKHSSIADRLKEINCEYFKDIFEYYSKELQSKHVKKYKGMPPIERFDSTMVAISGSLVKWGMKVGAKAKKGNGQLQLKFTIGLRGLFPTNVKIFHDQKYISEDLAMKEVIEESIYSNNSICTFDRGIQNRKTFIEFSKQDKKFVTRAKSNVQYQIIKVNKQIKGRKINNLILQEDLIVKLKQSRGKIVDAEFRLIIAKDSNTDQIYMFLTNILDQTAKMIIQIYGYRWDIEVFFRFLKQELNFDSIKPYNENGIKVMMYMTLIAAMLILLYKKVNKIEGYKIAKLQFFEDIEKEIIGRIVVDCGGDLGKFKQLYRI
jgi:hypothetical protein